MGLQFDEELQQQLDRVNPQFGDQLRRLEDEFNRETDRGAALVCAAFLDERLHETLAAHFVQHKDADRLFKTDAPLSTFSARIRIAFALGLISELEYKQCEIIRNIRNDFAHKLERSFGEQCIKDLASNFSIRMQGNPTDARGKFIVTCLLLGIMWAARLPDVPRSTLKPGRYGYWE
jgi:mannitol operon repressor